MASETLEYYRTLLSDRSWYAEGLCWTVIQPAGSDVTVDEVMRRLRAEPVNLDEIRFPHVNDLRPEDPSPFLVAHLRQVGSDVVMMQDNGCEGARHEVLRWLSDRARVHTVDWTINGNGGVTCAVYGSVLARVDKNHPERCHGTHPDAFDGDLADLIEAKQLRDNGEWPASRLVAEAAAMATVERRTGIRLREEWVDDLAGPQWTTVMIGRIPSDPRPPGRFGRTDPDLDARLRGAPEPVRRRAVAAGLRQLLATFVVSDEAVATAVIDAVERGEPVAPDLRTRAFHLCVVGSPGADGGHLGSAFHDAVAQPYGYPLDSLASVRAALGDGWPVLRRTLM